jgi:hypothetical protein
MPPQNPLTRLEQVALDLGRFADELTATTDLEATVLRYWQAELIDIVDTLARSGQAERETPVP